MTLIEALGIVTDLAGENMLREDQINDDLDDPLWDEFDHQHKAAEVVARFAALLEEE